MPRVNITISQELKDYFENLSKETGAPQSSLMAFALKEYCDQKNMMKNLPDMLKAIKYLSDKENL